MATPSSPQPIYHSPALGPRQRRRSSRLSLTTSLALQTSPTNESPRTLCPPDDGSFSYDPAHLPTWCLPQGLWDRLPTELHSVLGAMQHSAAAVVTGFERLEKHTKTLNGGLPTHQVDGDELLVQLDSLPPPKLRAERTDSNASSFFQSDSSCSVFTDHEPHDSEAGSPSTSFSASQSTAPVSPIWLTPADGSFVEKSARSRDRSFSTPLEPHDAYYVTELSHLRTEAIPRLRHAVRKVNTEWGVAKRSHSIPAQDILDFENWWVEKQSNIIGLEENGKRLSHAVGVSPTGMGWTAP